MRFFLFIEKFIKMSADTNVILVNILRCIRFRYNDIFDKINSRYIHCKFSIFDMRWELLHKQYIVIAEFAIEKVYHMIDS